MKHKHSRKRDAIMAAVASTKTHPTAEWVYQRLKPEIPDLSLGTVYRNLAAFREEGALLTVAHVGGGERYDADTSSHAHFICDVCGAVHDADGPEEDGPDGVGRLRARGFTVTRRQVLYYGTCAACADADQVS